jgi:hypothetical protein
MKRKICFFLFALAGVFFIFITGCKKDNEAPPPTSNKEGIELTYGSNQFLCYNKQYAIYYLHEKRIVACFLKNDFEGCDKNSLSIGIPNINFDSIKNSFNPLNPQEINLNKATVQFRKKVDTVMFQDYFLNPGSESAIIIDIITPDDFIAGHFSGKFYAPMHPQNCEMIPSDENINDSLDLSSGTFLFKIEKQY